MKTPLLLVSIALLTACQASSPVQMYRPANYGGAPMQITGISEGGFLKDTIKIMINGEVVTTFEFSGSIQAFSGIYEKYQIGGKCFKVADGGYFVNTQYIEKKRTVCDVLVNNEQAATLQF